MPTQTVSPGTEKLLCQYCWVINTLKDTYGILTTTLVQASTSTSDLIARLYAALESSSNALYGVEARMLVRTLEQGVRLGETNGLITDALVALLSTVNTVNSGTTDLRWLLGGGISDTGNLDITKDWSPGADLGFAAAVTG